MSEINSAAVGITEEMIADAAVAMLDIGGSRMDKDAYWKQALRDNDRAWYLKQARAALEAALAGRTVVDLPEPEHVDIDDPSSRPHARWDVDSYVVTAVAMAVGPRVNVRGGPLLFAEEAETRGAALIAAARTARRLASGSPKGGDPTSD